MANVKELLSSKDCEKDLLEALSRTDWLKGKYKANQLSLDVLEKLYKKVSKKYKAYISYVREAGDDSWVFMVSSEKTHEHSWVYCRTLLEGIAKVLLLFYMHFKKGMPFEVVNKGGKK